MPDSLVLEMKEIHHSYGQDKALCGVDFNLNRGEIHALVGNRRSGKSTLARILTGQEKKQNGRIFIKNTEFSTMNSSLSRKNHIAMVHQFTELIPTFNAIDNIFLGMHKRFIITGNKRKEMEIRSLEILNTFSPGIPLDIPLYKLSESHQQIINMSRILAHDPDILILDEISRTLSSEDMEKLRIYLNEMKSRGKSIIYITSTVNEIFELADRVTILNNGYRRGTEPVSALDPRRLVDMAFNLALSQKEGETKQQNDGLLDILKNTMIDDLPIGDILLDKNDRVILTNKSAAALLGRPIMNNSHIRDLIKRFTDCEGKIMTAYKSGDRKVLTGLPMQGKFLKLTMAPVRNNRSEEMGTNIMVEDVTFDYHTREYLTRINKTASTAELAAGVAHEIKNPLAIIQNYVELLKLEQSKGESPEHLIHIEKELNRIVEIIGSLLSFSRVKQNNTQRVNLKQLLDEVSLLMEHKIQLKLVDFSKSTGVEDVFLSGNENKLKQLFINLLSNALEAVLDKGIIKLDMKKKNKTVHISVTDNGYGIPEEIQDDIFTPFYTTKMTRTNTGLGLSICQNIAETHGGVITFRSVPGQETRFTVALPLKE